MKNYVINLAHSADRREYMQQELKKINIEPHFFPAVYGKELTAQEMNTRVCKDNLLSPGEIGCALSHLNVYQEMIEQNIPYAIVFEDDILINEQLKLDVFNQIEQFVKHYPADKAIVLSLHNSRGKGNTHLKINNQITIDKRISDIFTHAYLINLQAAKNILEIQTPLRFEIDSWKYYVYLDAIKFFTSNISLISQKGFQSEIWLMDNRDEFFSKEKEKLRKINFNNYFKTKPLSIKLKAYFLRLLKLLNIRKT